jgi:hypothetical protein
MASPKNDLKRALSGAKEEAPPSKKRKETKRCSVANCEFFASTKGKCSTCSREAVRREAAHPRAQNDAPSPRCPSSVPGQDRHDLQGVSPRACQDLQGQGGGPALRRAVLCLREEGEAVFSRHLWDGIDPAEGGLVCHPQHRERAGRRAVRVGHLLHGQRWSHQGLLGRRGRRHRCSRHTLLMCSASTQAKNKMLFSKDLLSQSP